MQPFLTYITNYISNYYFDVQLLGNGRYIPCTSLPDQSSTCLLPRDEHNVHGLKHGTDRAALFGSSILNGWAGMKCLAA